jgi:hypothetical protein
MSAAPALGLHLLVHGFHGGDEFIAAADQFNHLGVGQLREVEGATDATTSHSSLIGGNT